MKLKSMFFCVLLLAMTAAGYAKDLEVVRVWPEKLLYAPEETAQFTVTLRNSGTTEQRADLVVTLLTDVATESELMRRAVTVTADTNEKVVVSAPLREEFGHEVVAVLMQKGQEISRAREVFTVTDHAPLVSQYSFWTPDAGTEKDLRERLIPMWRSNYVSMLEIYFWSPSSFGDFAPETEHWWAGEVVHTHGSKSAVRTYIEEAHKHGIKVLTYINHAFWGRRSWEILREHPEWAMYLGNGQWYARFDYEETDGRPMVPEELLKSSVCMINFVDVGAVDFGTQALIDGMKMFDYDGARWDGQWTVSGDYGTSDFFDLQGRLNPRYPESDELATRNYKRVKELVRKVRSGFICGYNYGVRFREGAGTTLPKFYAETMDHGWLLWENAQPMMQNLSGFETWRRVADVIREETTPARRAGGELYLHVNTSSTSWSAVYGTPVYHSYLCALAFANRAHLSSPSDLGHWYRFALRYGGLLYDPRLEPIPATGIKVQAEAHLWWEQTIYRRALSTSREQLIIHLINPPVNDKVDQKEKTAPTVRKNVQVSVPVPTGSRLAAVWVLSPDPDTHGERLTPGITDDIATVTVPELAFWDVVVFEFEKEGK